MTFFVQNGNSVQEAGQAHSSSAAAGAAGTAHCQCAAGHCAAGHCAAREGFAKVFDVWPWAIDIPAIIRRPLQRRNVFGLGPVPANLLKAFLVASRVVFT